MTMNSKIQTELASVTETNPSTRAKEQITDPGYMLRLATAVGALSDADWNSLSADAVAWYNAAADAVEKKQPIPVFADLPQPEAAPAAGTRRRAAPTPAPAPAAPKQPEVGDPVSFTTPRGATVEGVVTVLDAEGAVVTDASGKEHELTVAQAASMVVIGGAAQGDAGAGAAGPDEPEVGDTVQVVTMRGKTIMGKITELTDEEVVMVDAAGETHEYRKDRLTSFEIKAKGAAAPAAPAAPAPAAGARRGAAAPAAAPAAPGARVTRDQNGGVSVTRRIRELMCHHLGSTQEQIDAMLKKEGLVYKPQTLDISYSETNKVIDALRAAGKLK